MNVQTLALAVIAQLIGSNTSLLLAGDTVVRVPDAVVHAGDLVAINIPKILSSFNEKSNPQISRIQIEIEDQRSLIGLPIVVFKDGTISLPLLKPVPADGLTIRELEAAIAEAYVRAQILRTGESTIIAAIVGEKR